jgi:3-phosphoshikimate 1-carboxyvinyltransferase
MPVVTVPGSKSITARALLLAAAADGVTTLVRPLRSDDTEGFAEGLVRLGYRVGRTRDALRVPGISFDDPGCVRKTFPGFHEEFGALRARW